MDRGICERWSYKISIFSGFFVPPLARFDFPLIQIVGNMSVLGGFLTRTNISGFCGEIVGSLHPDPCHLCCRQDTCCPPASRVAPLHSRDRPMLSFGSLAPLSLWLLAFGVPRPLSSCWKPCSLSLGSFGGSSCPEGSSCTEGDAGLGGPRGRGGWGGPGPCVTSSSAPRSALTAWRGPTSFLRPSASRRRCWQSQIRVS